MEEQENLAEEEKKEKEKWGLVFAVGWKSQPEAEENEAVCHRSLGFLVVRERVFWNVLLPLNFIPKVKVVSVSVCQNLFCQKHNLN